MIGRSIGRFRIVGKLGQGGMGSVWKAEDPVLGRAVALKFLPEELAASPEARQRFLREARAASALDHPGVATVYDVVEADDTVYLAMACIDGDTVGELAAGHPLPPIEVVRIAEAVAEALAHAHGRGVLHRDITSRNIMVARDGRVVVLDFGLALPPEATRLTSASTLLGTVAYMAPEVACGRPADARSDLYGLGVVMYEALTGAPPFCGERAEAVLYMAVHEPPEPPGTRTTGIPPALERLVLRLLSKDPEQRPQTATELAAALRGLESEAERKAPGRSRRPVPHTPRIPGTPSPLPEQKCLAVLPFRDLEAGTDPDDAASAPAHVFARGLAEVMSARLARLAGLQVIPPSGSGAGASPDQDARRAARTLGANLVLCGTVRRGGGQVRVSYSILSPQGVQLAADTVDGASSDLFSVEDQLAESVRRSLQLNLGTPVPAGTAAVAQRRAAAHEKYLQALGYLQRPEIEAAVDGAISRLDELLASGDADGAVHAALGRACLNKFELTREPGWAERAVQACGAALELEPGSPELLITLASLYSATGRQAKAVQHLKRALKLRPDSAEAQLGLARAYSAQGKAALAEEAAHRAIALRPTHWIAHNTLGTVAFKQGHYEQALSAWKRVIELRPDNARGHSNLGAAYFRLGRYDLAIEAYRRAIDIQPGGSACTSLGTVYFYLGQYAAAAAMFERGVTLRPSDARMWGNLADAHRWSPGMQEQAAGAYERAIALAEEQLRVNPRDSEQLGYLAEWLAKCGRAREASQVLSRALKMEPGNLDCLAHSVRVHHMAGRREQALQALAEVVRLGFGIEEFERDPELATLRQDPAYPKAIRRPRDAGPTTD
jgi:eukaryotic-like serine/threonine-protein kinase